MTYEPIPEVQPPLKEEALPPAAVSIGRLPSGNDKFPRRQERREYEAEIESRRGLALADSPGTGGGDGAGKGVRVRSVWSISCCEVYSAAPLTALSHLYSGSSLAYPCGL